MLSSPPLIINRVESDEGRSFISYFQNICIAIIIDAKNKHDIVLAVNILSLKKIYVIIAKTKLDTPKPMSFEDHS